MHAGRLLQKAESTTPEHGSDGCRRDDGPTPLLFENIPDGATCALVGCKTKGVAKRLEDGVEYGMRAEVEHVPSVRGAGFAAAWPEGSGAQSEALCCGRGAFAMEVHAAWMG